MSETHKVVIKKTIEKEKVMWYKSNIKNETTKHKEELF